MRSAGREGIATLTGLLHQLAPKESLPGAQRHCWPVLLDGGVWIASREESKQERHNHSTIKRLLILFVLVSHGVLPFFCPLQELDGERDALKHQQKELRHQHKQMQV